MNRWSPLRPFALVLCALALLAAQTFGAKAAYYCLCGGQPVPAQTSHCYGPHGEKCAQEIAPSGENDGERRDHQVVKQGVQLRPVEATPTLLAPPSLLAILPMAEPPFAREAAILRDRFSTDFEESPPLGITVARTIVLRI